MSRSCSPHGIDVYTTLNIQHVESLNDVVAQITRIRVRETVPDSILDRADEIELVDLTPDDLIQRLKEGKVYVPQAGASARSSTIFSPGNLTALRELALRRTAERVDEQLLSDMQAHAISGPWAAGERVLVCVSEDPRAAGPRALRQAPRRPAARPLDGALCRDPAQPAAERGGARPDRRYAAARGAARRRGGDHPRQRRIADDVHRLSRRRTMSPISSSANRAARDWFELLHGSVVHDLVRRCGNISVHVIAGEELAKRADPEEDGAHGRAQRRPSIFAPTRLRLLAVGSRARRRRPCAAVARHREHRARLPDRRGRESPFATDSGRRCVASVAASLCYNFFFLPPLYTFTIADPTNVAAFSSSCWSRGHRQSYRAGPRPGLHRRARARTTEELYAFSRKLAGVGTLDDCCGRPPTRSPRC